jgi:hypothetical protein
MSSLSALALESASNQAVGAVAGEIINDDLENGQVQSRIGSREVAPRREYFKDRAATMITIYQGVSGVAGIAGVVALIAGVLLKDPYILSMGIGLIFIGGGGAVIAGKYRDLKSHNQIFDDMLAENSRLKGQVVFFESQNKNLEQSNVQLKGQVGELSNKLVTLQQTVLRFDQENDELRQSNQQLSEQILDLSTKVRELLESVRKFNEENAELKNSNSALKGHVSDLETMKGKFEVSVGELVKNEQAFRMMRERFELLQTQFSSAQEKEIAHDLERQKVDSVRQDREEQMLLREEEGIRQLQLLAQKDEILLAQEAEIVKGMQMLQEKEVILKQQEERIVQSLQSFAVERGDLVRLRQLISNLRQRYPEAIAQVEAELVVFVDIPTDPRSC